jgi:hypothetical protein
MNIYWEGWRSVPGSLHYWQLETDSSISWRLHNTLKGSVTYMACQFSTVWDIQAAQIRQLYIYIFKTFLYVVLSEAGNHPQCNIMLTAHVLLSFLFLMLMAEDVHMTLPNCILLTGNARYIILEWWSVRSWGMCPTSRWDFSSCMFLQKSPDDVHLIIRKQHTFLILH